MQIELSIFSGIFRDELLVEQIRNIYITSHDLN